MSVTKAPTDEFVRRATLERIVDGDTLRLKIDLGFGASIIHDVRLEGVDTPEARGVESAAGQFVSAKVGDWFAGNTELLIHSHVFELGKFGRCLCRVWANSRCLNEYLIQEGLAWKTDPRGRVSVARSVENLSGIPEGIKQRVREAMVA